MWSVWLVFCDCGFHSVCPLKDKDKRLMDASWWKRLTLGKLGFVLVGGAMLNKSLIQFSVDGQGSVPLFGLRPNYGGGSEENDNLFPKLLGLHCHIQRHRPCSRPPPTHASTGDSWHSQASLGQPLWGHCSFLLGPGAHKVLFVPSKSLFPQSCVSSVIKSHWPPKSNSLGVLSPSARSPGWEICCGS